MFSLRDQNLIAFIAEGYFYLIDISEANEENSKLLVTLNIRIPNEQITTFDIDFNMHTLIMGTTGGNVYVYDLPKALENERILRRSKLSLGVEEELVYTYLE